MKPTYKILTTKLSPWVVFWECMYSSLKNWWGDFEGSKGSCLPTICTSNVPDRVAILAHYPLFTMWGHTKPQWSRYSASYWSSILPRISLQPWALTSNWGHPLSVGIMCTCVHTVANVLVQYFSVLVLHIFMFFLFPNHQLMNKPELGWTGWVTGGQDTIVTCMLSVKTHM